MTRRFWLAGLAGGVAMFIWAAIAHLATPLATAGFQRIPNEPTVMTSIQNGTGGRSGLFIFPYMAPDSAAAGPQRGLASKGSGLLLYHSTYKPLEARQLIGEFLLELFEAMLATALLSDTTLKSFLHRVGFFAVIGVLVAVTTNGSYWLFYGFPAAFSLAAMATELGKFLFAGVAAALVLARTPAVAA